MVVDQHALGAELMDGPVSLADRAVHVVEIDGGGEAHEAVGIFRAEFRQFVIGDARQLAAGVGGADFLQRGVGQADQLAIVGHCVHVAEAHVEIGQRLHRQQAVDDIAKLGRQHHHAVEKAAGREVGVDVDDHGGNPS